MKLIDRVLDAVTEPFDEVTDDQKAGPIEPIMAVNADQRAWTTAVSVSFNLICYFTLQPVNQCDEISRLIHGRRNLRHGRMFMVVDPALLQLLRVVDWVFVADINDCVNFTSMRLGEENRVMLLVYLSEHLQSQERPCDRL